MTAGKFMWLISVKNTFTRQGKGLQYLFNNTSVENAASVHKKNPKKILSKWNKCQKYIYFSARKLTFAWLITAF